MSQPHMVDKGRKPRLVAPPGACDTHSHVYVPAEKYAHHPGRTPAKAGVQHAGFRALLRFLESGNCYVKISAPYLGPVDLSSTPLL